MLPYYGSESSIDRIVQARSHREAMEIGVSAPDVASYGDMDDCVAS